MNNNDNNDDYNHNIDKSFKLFKLIFRNKFLVKKIYKVVRGINKQITNSDINNKSFDRVCKYNDASFDWCIKNKHYQLIYDKIRIGTIFNKDDLNFNNLFKFIQQFQIQQQQIEEEEILINKFFHYNKSTLLNTNYSSKETNFIEFNSLLSFSIYTQNLNFIKAVYNGIDCKIIKTDTTDGCELLELAIKLGNLDIIDYCIQTIGIKLNLDIKNIDKIISYTLASDNRDKVLEFLFKNIKDHNYDTNENNDNRPRYYLFSNKLKLSNITNFKQFYQIFGFLMKYDIGEHTLFSRDIINRIIEDYNENTFIDLLNFLQISLFIISNQLPLPLPSSTSSSQQIANNKEIEKLKIKSNQLLKKINHLIEYNNTKDDGLIQIYKNEKEQQEKDEINNNNNNKPMTTTTTTTKKKASNKNNKDSTSTNSISKKIGSIFKSKSITDRHDGINKEKKKIFKFDEIVYKDFNLKREIYRLFIFEYLKFIIKYETISYEKIDQLIGEFSSKYNEHALIKEFLESKNDEAIELNLSSFKLCLSLISTAIKNLDSKLIDLLPEILNCSGLAPHINLNPTSLKQQILKLPQQQQLSSNSLDNHGQLIVNKQIEIIKSYFKLNYTFVTNILSGKLLKEITLLKSFFKNNKDLIDYQHHANEIAKLISDTGKSKLISPRIFAYNFKIFKYFFENFNQLFQWESHIISKKVIKTNNLEFIQFLYDNNIGSIKDVSCLQYSKTRMVAEFMYNQFGFRFKNVYSFELISKLDDWDSNYLFYYSITKLVEELQLESGSSSGGDEINVPIGISWKSNFFHWQCIKNSGLLNFDNLVKENDLLSFQQKILFFNSLDYVISTTCNKNIIKRFLKQISDENNSNFYLELSYKTHKKLKKENYNQQFDFLLKNKFIKK